MGQHGGGSGKARLRQAGEGSGAGGLALAGHGQEHKHEANAARMAATGSAKGTRVSQTQLMTSTAESRLGLRTVGRSRASGLREFLQSGAGQTKNAANRHGKQRAQQPDFLNDNLLRFAPSSKASATTTGESRTASNNRTTEEQVSEEKHGLCWTLCTRVITPTPGAS